MALFLLSAVSNGYAESVATDEQKNIPEGMSFVVGGQYTWMSFTTPPTFTGSTGGALAKITYERPFSFFGEVRTFFSKGSLSSSVNSSGDTEWYTEAVGGYCFAFHETVRFTPFLGVGLDYLWDNKGGYGSIAPIDLKYQTEYLLAGFSLGYFQPNWNIGIKGSCLPIYSQFLSIGGLTGAAWNMKHRVGAEVDLPIGFRVSQRLWLELVPYYRFFPIGASQVLGLPSRFLNEWGGVVSVRLFSR